MLVTEPGRRDEKRREQGRQVGPSLVRSDVVRMSHRYSDASDKLGTSG